MDPQQLLSGTAPQVITIYLSIALTHQNLFQYQDPNVGIASEWGPLARVLSLILILTLSPIKILLTVCLCVCVCSCPCACVYVLSIHIGRGQRSTLVVIPCTSHLIFLRRGWPGQIPW